MQGSKLFKLTTAYAAVIITCAFAVPGSYAGVTPTGTDQVTNMDTAIRNISAVNRCTVTFADGVGKDTATYNIKTIDNSGYVKHAASTGRPSLATADTRMVAVKKYCARGCSTMQLTFGVLTATGHCDSALYTQYDCLRSLLGPGQYFTGGTACTIMSVVEAEPEGKAEAEGIPLD